MKQRYFHAPFLGVPELTATKKSLATPLLPDSASPKLVLSQQPTNWEPSVIIQAYSYSNPDKWSGTHLLISA